MSYASVRGHERGACWGGLVQGYSTPAGEAGTALAMGDAECVSEQRCCCNGCRGAGPGWLSPSAPTPLASYKSACEATSPHAGVSVRQSAAQSAPAPIWPRTGCVCELR